MLSDKTRSEEDCNGDIMTGIGLSHETLPTLREGSWAQMIHILHYMVYKLQSPKCVPQINRSFWLAPRVIVPLHPWCESAQKWPLVQMVVMGKGDAALMILETAEEAEPQTEERAHQNPSCLLYKLYIHMCPDYDLCAQIICCTCCTYMPRLCLNCVPTRTHHVSCHSLGCSPAFGHSFH